MPYSDPSDKRAHNKAWMAADRKKKRTEAGMSIAERIRAGRALAKAAGLPATKKPAVRNSDSDQSPTG
jgi:hypothetical protein